jgi:opacity protein-like surface antigen
MKYVMVLAAGVLAAASVSAQERAVMLHYGEQDNYSRTGLSVRVADVWRSDYGRWRAAIHPEFELSRFRYSGGGSGASSLDQGGAAAIARFARNDGAFRPYIEAGLGGALFSRSSLGGKGFGTRFQFGEHLGAGIEFSGGWSAGWRYSHYSNADMEKPNDGLDLHQLLIGARF